MNLWEGATLIFEIRYPLEKIRPNMIFMTKMLIGQRMVLDVLGDYIRTAAGAISYSDYYNYSIVDLKEAIELEDDLAKKLALMALDGDPQALDIIQDALNI